MNDIRKPSLLAPAGTPEALDAAIAAGADAVYFGADAFNARMFAGNFSGSVLEESIKKCRYFGVESNLTVNTLVTGREEAELLRLCERLYRLGADALIVADLGTAAAIHRAIPEFALHASTQCGGHNVEAARAFSAIGFSRMVAAREMSSKDLETLCRESPIETEIFIHGALCVSTSGGCLFSAMVGGRSGNRGECAQPCRLACRVDGGRDEYALSLRDNCLAPHMKKILSFGAAALKIEGRMKSPEYVYGVTKCYRRLLDEERNATPEEIRALEELFSRGGFTDAYFRGDTACPMGGIRSEKEKEATARAERAIRSEYQEPKIPAQFSARLRADEPIRLTLCARGKTVTVTGQIPERAITAPQTEESVCRQIGKLGATPFTASVLKADVGEGLAVPPAALNALRRDGAEALLGALSEGLPRTLREEAVPLCHPVLPRQTPTVHASFLTLDGIPEGARDVCGVLFVPLDEYLRDPDRAAALGVTGVMLPPILYEAEAARAEKALLSARQSGCRHVLFSGFSQLAMCRRAELLPHADVRCNLFGASTLALYAENGVADAVLSPELTEKAAAALPRYLPRGAVVYGRLPLMTLERCILRTGGRDCRACEEADTVRYLKDRLGVRFPVRRLFPHRNVIYNSVPTWMLDRTDELSEMGLDLFRLFFTVEDKKRASEILRAFTERTAADCPARRMGRRREKPKDAPHGKRR